VLHPQARADLLAAVEYYERESWGLAGRFSAEMERLVAEVGANPGVFHVFRKSVRRHFGGHFPYAVIYVERADVVQILAFAHFKRRPGYWVDRLLRELR
jgi:saccharopine dehydrogenase-like NADP-dependent oxidoreductase